MQSETKKRFWQKIPRTSQSTRSTIALAIALAASLAGAQLLVMQRSAPLYAYTNAESLINEIRHNGLDQYLKKPQLVYYITEKKGKKTGYGAISLAPGGGGELKVIVGNSFFCYLEAKYFYQTQFEITNDLDSYRYVQQATNLQGEPLLLIDENFSKGKLYISHSRTAPSGLDNVQMYNIPESYFVPQSLLDFFSSLALANRKYRDGVVFGVIDLDKLATGRKDILTKCYVREGGKVPDTVKSGHPGGRSARVRWLNKDRRQAIYYSSQHELLWQKDTISQRESILKAVTLKELQATFPGAREQFSKLKWLNHDNNNIYREEL